MTKYEILETIERKTSVYSFYSSRVEKLSFNLASIYLNGDEFWCNTTYPRAAEFPIETIGSTLEEAKLNLLWYQINSCNNQIKYHNTQITEIEKEIVNIKKQISELIDKEGDN